MRVITITTVMLLAGANLLSAGYITPSLQAVLDTLSPGNKTLVSVHLVQRSNLARFPQKAYAEKVAYLKEFSQRSQQSLIDFVNSYGNQVEGLRSFWVYNGFTLKATEAVIQAIASRSEVDYVNGGSAGEMIEPTGKAPPPSEIEWNIQRVRASDVWTEPGYTGDGIVICIFDTGMLENHESWWTSPDNNKWRSKVEGELHWEYAWHDANPENPSSTPIDNIGHGTHVGGIALGGDGYNGNLRDIGVAPGAELIACTAQYGGSPHDCFQWIADLVNTPYGNLAPDVVNCSWGYYSTNLEYWQDIKTLRNLGIITVFCGGNNWMYPYVWAPGNYPLTIGVGATDINDNKASFSSPGPAPDQNPWNDETYWPRPDWDLIKPDIMAPGTDFNEPGSDDGIVSADYQNPNGYVKKYGTSMATPHITGAIALMQQAAMDLWGHKLNFYDIYNLLIESANPVGQPVPNNYYGWGRLDCKSAIDSVQNFVQKSSSCRALSYNNQRVIVYDENNDRLHLVYQTGKAFSRPGAYIRYTTSVDDGQSWDYWEEKVADGDSPCLAVDAQGNPHCLFRDGNTISYARRINNTWEGPFILYEDDFALGFSVPSFLINGNTGYLGFEFQNQWLTSYLVIGTFDITAQNPTLQHTNIDASDSYRFGAPGLALVQYYGVIVTYTRKINGIEEIYYRSSRDDWQSLNLVSNNDGIVSTAPSLFSTASKVWFFWEDGSPSDIYYRVLTPFGWQNSPGPVYTSSNPSCAPRAFYNSQNSDKVYVVWSELIEDCYDILYSAYYGNWQVPVNISNNSLVDSRMPDLSYIPAEYIEGKIVIVYTEGNEHWAYWGPYLPIYRLKTYRTTLPFGGGGAQARGEVSSTRFYFNILPNPAVGSVTIRFGFPWSTKLSLVVYDVSGKRVKELINKKVDAGEQKIFWDGRDEKGDLVPAGVYFVRLEAGDYKKTEKVVLIK